jgi:RNA-directed DNA polymerase
MYGPAVRRRRNVERANVKAASMYQTSSGGRARVSSSLDGNPGVIACGAKLREIKEDLRRRIHQLIPEQGRWLAQVIRGYIAYDAVPTNFSALSAIRYHVMRHWLWTLRRRSQKDNFAWGGLQRCYELGRGSP